MVPLDKELQRRNIKQKPVRQIYVYSCMLGHILKHIQLYSGTIRHIQELFRHAQPFSEPCEILAYLEHWHIQNQKHIHNCGIFRTIQWSSDPHTFMQSNKASTQVP